MSDDAPLKYVAHAESRPTHNPGRRVGFYDDDRAARVAVKMLMNSGFNAEQVFVLCSNESWTGDSLTTRIYVGGPHHDAATVFTATLGAGIGVVAGAALLPFFPWPVALIAAGIGGVLGGIIGGMLGAGTFNTSPKTKQLADLYRDQIDKGLIVVVVDPAKEDDNAKMDRAAELLSSGRAEQRAAG